MEIKRLERVLDCASIFLWSWDIPQDRFEIAHTHGFFADELSDGVMTTADWEARILPEDLAAGHPILAECLEGTRNSYSFVVRLRPSNGTQVWVQDQGWVTERDENGRALVIVGLRQDITHFKEIEKKLRTQQTHLDIVAQAADMCFWTYDCAKDELKFSEHFYQQYGYAHSGQPENPTQWWAEKVHPDDLPKLRKELAKYISNADGRYDMEYRIRDAFGKYQWVRSTGCIVDHHDDGAPAHIAGSLINIDHLKKTESSLQQALMENRIFSERLQREANAKEEELRLSKSALNRHRRLLGTVTDLGVKLSNARVQDAHEAMHYSLRNLGQSVHADRVYVLKHIEQGEESHLQMYREWQEDYSFSGVHWNLGDTFTYQNFPGWQERLREGEFINSHVSRLTGPARAFFDKLRVQSVLLIPVHLDTVFWGVVYFGDSHKVRLSDEEELKTLQSGSYLVVQAALRVESVLRLREALEQAQAGTRAKTQFLANMSHEMRTPLNAILGLVSMAKKPSADYLSCLNGIGTAAGRLKALVHDVLEMARLSTDSFQLRHERFSIPTVLEHIHSTYSGAALKKGHDFRLGADNITHQLFYGDSALLELALGHLVANAIEFTPDHGTIQLTATQEDGEDMTCTLRFSVIDNGPGIKESLLAKIFQPFEQGENTLTREHEGTGLGLAIVRRIADNTGGTLQVASSPGKGSTFSLTCKLEKAPDDTVDLAAPSPFLGQPLREEAEQHSRLAGKHILIVEDNEINREILLAMLEDMHCTADCAENGQVAVDMLREKPGLYSVILMDIHMPVLDGYSASRAIRSLPDKAAANVPIVALTANCFPEDLEKSKTAGMNGHIGKPIDYQELRTVLEACATGQSEFVTATA